ncbi:hypothetical protein WA026_014145 [Henosepilachna vigintioctopunctata]|uniref:Transposase n=1 Tax=Henosepilachna vigintioctopunctata TaxID=420089 RepID=A0AAW1TX07_9CUCU
MAFESKLYKNPLSSQSLEIVYNILKFMKDESTNNTVTIPLSKVMDRVAAATRVSIATINRIKREACDIESNTVKSFSTSNKRRSDRNSRIRLDDFDLADLRRTILNFHVTDKRVPTTKRIHRKFCSDFNYQGSTESLRKEVKKLGFRSKKFQNNRTVLMEKPDVRHSRVHFLKKMSKYREEGRNILYVDESYIHSTHTKEKYWTDNSKEVLKKPISKDQR